MRCEINLYQQDQLYTLAIENVFRSKMSGIVLWIGTPEEFCRIRSSCYSLNKIELIK